MSDTIVLSPQGKLKLEEELEDLKKNKRKQVAERISTAKEFGDLSENAEYHEAKEEQAFIEGRILELEHILKVAQVVLSVESHLAGIGSKLTVEKDGKPMNLTLVGATEADPTNGRISLDSPLGQALLQKTSKDEFDLETPGGTSHYKIITIQ